MRHGKYFKLVHLSFWDMGREWESFMFTEKKKSREIEKGKGEKVGGEGTFKKSRRKER